MVLKMVKRVLLGILLGPMFTVGLLCSLSFWVTGHVGMGIAAVFCGLTCIALTAILSRD